MYGQWEMYKVQLQHDGQWAVIYNLTEEIIARCDEELNARCIAHAMHAWLPF